MARLWIAAMVLVWISGTVQAQACGDIRQFDFRNAAIPIAARDEGGRSGPALFRLRDGKGCLSDDPDSPQSHDWRLDLLLVGLAHPNRSTWIRVIVVDKNHVTGSGDWHYVMAFGCTNGSLVSLFQYGAEGVALRHWSDETLDLYQAVWTGDDGHCCPGRNRELVYKWNAIRHRYDRASDTSAPGFTPVPDGK